MDLLQLAEMVCLDAGASAAAAAMSMSTVEWREALLPLAAALACLGAMVEREGACVLAVTCV